MLYDPKWEQQTKSDPFTLESLIAWLEKQPPSKSYRYTCNGHCLLSQYFSAAGFENVFMYSMGFTHGPRPLPIMNSGEAEASGLMITMPRLFNEIAVESPATFGAALERARSALG